MLAPVSAAYTVTVRNSGDEVVLSDDDVRKIVAEYLEREYEGVLFDVSVERVEEAGD